MTPYLINLNILLENEWIEIWIAGYKADGYVYIHPLTMLTQYVCTGMHNSIRS